MINNNLICSGMSWTITTSDQNDQAEAMQIYFEAESYIIIHKDHGAILPQLENFHEDWKIMPMGVVDPDLQDKWKAARLWMMDPFDMILGDDAMPALCGGCDGIFWGDEMISIANTIVCLRHKHNRTINNVFGNVWEETEPHIIRKLRTNRICKKCHKVSRKAYANLWRKDYGETISIPKIQASLPFTCTNGTLFPNLGDLTAGMPVDCVSDTYTESTTTKDDDI